MAIQEIIVTPDIAKKFLEKNTNNRSLCSKRVNRLANAMLRGEWQFNGDTVRVAKSGRLLDGQHRLSAIAQSGIAQRCLIVNGLDDEAFTTIDVGAARNAAQMLGMAGEKNTSATAAAARMYLLYKSVGKPVFGSPDKQPTHTQIVDFAEGNEELALSAGQIKNKWCVRYIGPANTAFCHYVFSQVDKYACERFFSEIASGDFSYSNSPIKFLRELFIEERGQSGSPDRSRRIALMFKAFRLYREGKESKILRLSKDQDEWFKL